MSESTEIRISNTASTSLAVAFILGVLSTCGVGWYFGVFNENPELARLRAHNDSVTVQVTKLRQEADSLAALAVRYARSADSAKAASDALTRTIDELGRQRGGMPHLVARLPDTGVVRRFQELIK